jgi:hypothetical protein
MPSSIQFLYSGVSSVAVVTAFPSVVSPARSEQVAQTAAQTSNARFRTIGAA